MALPSARSDEFLVWAVLYMAQIGWRRPCPAYGTTSRSGPGSTIRRQIPVRVLPFPRREEANGVIGGGSVYEVSIFAIGGRAPFPPTALLYFFAVFTGTQPQPQLVGLAASTLAGLSAILDLLSR